MKLKLDDAGNVVVIDGKPVYVHDDGKEIPFDAAATVATIGKLNGEAKSHRERAETAEGKLKDFDGIQDSKAALKALEIVKNLDDKKLVDAGEVEKVRAESIKAVEEKYAPIISERDKYRDDLYAEKVGGNFARSEYITGKLTIPADLAQARFGNAFKVEDGHVVAYGADGQKVFSRINPGQLASFDEALEVLVSNYPHKDSILKGSSGSGSGSQGSGGGANGSKVMNRQAFDQLDAKSQAGYMKDGGTLTD